MGRLIFRRYAAPNVPLVEASRAGARQRPSLIVLESSFTSSDNGAALAIALTFHRETAKESFHYVVDESNTFRCVPDTQIAKFGVVTKHAIGIQICDDPSGLRSRWDMRTHRNLMAQTADLVAQLCLTYKIPARYLTESELSKWRKWRIRRRGGIVTQGFMSQTYWPEDDFLNLVTAYMAKHKFNNDK